MSLKLRLLVTIVGLVVVVSLALSAVHLNTVAATWLTHLDERSFSTAEFVKRWILSRIAALPLPSDATIEETRLVWGDALASDPDLPLLLSGMLAQNSPIIEISVAGQDARIIASTDRRRIGSQLRDRLTLSSLLDLGPVDRLIAMLSGDIDYERRVDLGVLGQPLPVFRIQVLASSTTMRRAILPVIGSTAVVSLFSILIAVLLAYVVARLSLRPIERIADAIDLIASGQATLTAPLTSTSEFQAVEQKLRILGEQFLHAREGANELRSSADRRVAAINRLTSRVAHEIKNPLNSIALRLELLKSRVQPMSGEVEEEIRVITQEITRLDRVVRTFLDFTRPVELAAEDLDLAAVVSATVSILSAEAEASRVEVDWQQPPDTVMVRGDRGLLQQALWNVCRNALDAMPNGGRLRLTLERDGTQAVLTVADTGPGIPEADRERIFQLYYSTKPQGTGTGLAMAFRALQLHSGSIEAGGSAGHGAEFRLRLPAV